MSIGSEPPPAIGADTIRKIQASFKGEVFTPGHPGFDPARRLYNALIDRRPGVIVRCRDRADVRRAVELGREHQLLVAVRAGGHNVAGKALCDGGMVIDLTGMKGARVDPADRTIQADAGLTWGEFDQQTQAHGLATTGGFISSTGIAGLTLGGGLGWLMRKHGLACDNLLSAEIVTADGRLRSVSATEDPDLFWGLRGGGGNFGIVTSFEYRLHQIGPLLAGVVFFPLARAPEALRFYREMMATAPDELMAYGVFLTNPEGVKLFGIPVCYAGPMEAGERLLKPLRSLEYLAVDMVGPMSYCAVQSMFDPGFPPGRLNYWKSSFLKSLSDPAIELLTTSFESVPSPFAAVALEPFGGAVSRVGVEETAFPHRGASYSVVIVGMWADPAQTEAMVKWTRGLWTALQPHSTEAVYVNYLDTDDTARVSAAYGSATFKRLQAVKQKYDPDNFFRMNQNIRPVTSSASPPT